MSLKETLLVLSGGNCYWMPFVTRTLYRKYQVCLFSFKLILDKNQVFDELLMLQRMPFLKNKVKMLKQIQFFQNLFLAELILFIKPLNVYFNMLVFLLFHGLVFLILLVPCCCFVFVSLAFVLIVLCVMSFWFTFLPSLLQLQLLSVLFLRIFPVNQLLSPVATPQSVQLLSISHLPVFSLYLHISR